MEEKDILEKIYSVHKDQLNHLSVLHKKLLICFSGIPCSGKTLISKLIEGKYKAVRICNDDIRKIIKKLGKQDSRLLDEDYKEEILTKYVFNLLKNYQFKNKLIILDSGIDRRYNQVFDLAKDKQFKIFIITIQAPLTTLKHRVMTKPGWPDQNFINNMERWIKEHKEFNERIKTDIIIQNDENSRPNLVPLFSKLNKIIYS